MGHNQELVFCLMACGDGYKSLKFKGIRFDSIGVFPRDDQVSMLIVNMRESDLECQISMDG